MRRVLVAGIVLHAPAVVALALSDGAPWRLIAIVGIAAVAGQLAVWRAAELARERTAELSAELAGATAQAEQRKAITGLFVNLARRNQSLLDRQLTLIADLEQAEDDPERLAELFTLDHLATRIRRNAESLLVLSGAEVTRRWGRPVALADAARAAIAEVEDYQRARVQIDSGVAIAGRVVVDVAHLVAELVENGIAFSPPETPIVVASRGGSNGGWIVSVEDRGLGMTDADREAANALLADPPDIGLEMGSRLGLHVVGRLAARHGIHVTLVPNPAGGTIAEVELPSELVSLDESDPAPHHAAIPPPELVELRRQRSTGAEAVPDRPLDAPPPGGPSEPSARPVTPVAAPAPVPIPTVPAAVLASWSQTTPNGLPRRTPGNHLAPAAVGAPLLPSRSSAAVDMSEAATMPEQPANHDVPPGPIRARSAEEIRAALSRFQSSQTAARAMAADEPGGPR